MFRLLRKSAALVFVSLACSAACAQRALAPAPVATLTVHGGETSINGVLDSGPITIDFNGFVETVQYGQFSSQVSLASGLAAMFCRDYLGMGLYAKAGAHGNQDPAVITFQLATGAAFGQLNIVGSTASFSFSSSGFANSSPGTADIGVATLWFDGAAIAKANYGDGSTGASIAQDLALTASSSYVTVTAEGQNLYLRSKRTGAYTDNYSVTFSTSTSFSSSPASGTLSSSSGDASPVTVYSYGAVYDPAGNVLGLSDSVMGMWAYGYDNLNRLTSGVASSSGGPYAGQSACWNYDGFGNRLSESISMTPCNSSPPATFSANYGANNQISRVTSSPPLNIAYDGAGNVTNDGFNSYVYDGEGRLCAVNGPQGMIGYQYDDAGNRIGKGTISVMSCDLTANGYTPTTDYVLDEGGGQMTEVAVGGGMQTWVHSNVTANGILIATYDTTGTGLHFYLSDALGSRRVQTDAAGFPEQTCQSLPFGDQLYCTGSLDSPTEHHFTGKERDTESGLDYFGARYLSSSMGRWMSPDPSNWGVDFSNPQTWNKYAYVGNNPLSITDPNGLWWTYEHNNIIDSAFPGLSNEQRQILKNSSKQVDSESAMTQSEQYKHGMTSEDNDPYSSSGAWNPQYEYDDYIAQNEHEAKDIQADWIASGHTGIAPGALAAFGNALHAITDSKSPSHEGFQKVNWFKLVWHAREGIPFAYMGRKRAAAAAARAAFYDVFGTDMGQQATHEKVTSRIVPDSTKPVDPNQPQQQQ